MFIGHEIIIRHLIIRIRNGSLTQVILLIIGFIHCNLLRFRRSVSPAKTDECVHINRPLRSRRGFILLRLLICQFDHIIRTRLHRTGIVDVLIGTSLFGSCSRYNTVAIGSACFHRVYRPSINWCTIRFIGLRQSIESGPKSHNAKNHFHFERIQFFALDFGCSIREGLETHLVLPLNNGTKLGREILHAAFFTYNTAEVLQIPKLSPTDFDFMFLLVVSDLFDTTEGLFKFLDREEVARIHEAPLSIPIDPVIERIIKRSQIDDHILACNDTQYPEDVGCKRLHPNSLGYDDFPFLYRHDVGRMFGQHLCITRTFPVIHQILVDSFAQNHIIGVVGKTIGIHRDLEDNARIGRIGHGIDVGTKADCEKAKLTKVLVVLVGFLYIVGSRIHDLKQLRDHGGGK